MKTLEKQIVAPIVPIAEIFFALGLKREIHERVEQLARRLDAHPEKV